MLRAITASRPADGLPERLAPLVSPPAAIPAGGETRRPGPGTPSEDPDSARFALYDCLASHLLAASRQVPLAIVLDDLHWSDEPSLLALRFLASLVPAAPVLLLGTFRDTDAGPLLHELARGAQLIPLAGLDEPSIAELMAAMTGRAAQPQLAHQVWARTGGNPFFAREVTRLLDAGGNPGGGAVPAGVRDILEQRLRQLPPDCAALLGTAALIGPEFPVTLVATAVGKPVDTVTDLLEEAARHRLLVRLPAPAGQYRFVHDLFRETLAFGLRSGDRASRHLAIGRALAGAGTGTGSAPGDSTAAGAPAIPGTSAAPAAQLAAHFAAAGPAGAAEAVRYGTLAAAQAAGRLAYEDACALLEQALAAAGRAAPVLPASQRLSLLLDLGDARYLAGRAEPARQAYTEAAGLARATGDGDALTRAALGRHRLGARSGTSDPQTTGLLEEAAALPGLSGPPRALVLAALARDLHHQQLHAARSAGLAQEAMALARRSGDARVLGACLLAWHDVSWRPGSAAQRLPIATDIAALAERAGDPELYAQACQLRAAALLELAGPGGIAELGRYCRLAEQMHHPRARWNALTRRATLATLAGRLDEAATLTEAAMDLGMQIGEPDALGVAGTQTWVLGALGRPWNLPGLMPPFVYGRPADPLLQALPLLGRGDRAAAARLLAGYPLADLPRSHDLEPLIFAAWLFGELGPPEAREHVYQALLPLAGSVSVVGGTAACQGPVDLYLGFLAAALGQPGKASEHYQAALECAQRLGSPAWIAVAQQRLGAGNVFRLAGDVWRLRFSGREALVADGKGMHDLAMLLATPGQDVTVWELLGVPAPATGADAVLDAPARAAYRARLAELSVDVDSAEAAGDLGRAARARDERDFLVRELTTATGLSGRDRRLGDETEKARKTVTARIRHTIGRIARVHPELGEHLSASVRTGSRCGYHPATPVSWQT